MSATVWHVDLNYWHEQQLGPEWMSIPEKGEAECSIKERSDLDYVPGASGEVVSSYDAAVLKAAEENLTASKVFGHPGVFSDEWDVKTGTYPVIYKTMSEIEILEFYSDGFKDFPDSWWERLLPGIKDVLRKMNDLIQEGS